MSNLDTKRMISAYTQKAKPSLFLSGFFQSPQENFHNTEEVEIDIERSDEDISIVIENMATGYRMNSADLSTNKGFIPPAYKEAIGLNSFELLNRMPGVNPFANNDFRANLILKFFKGMRKIEDKLRRSFEQQASQILQTGILTLKDDAGVDLYTLDFKPKATHFPTAGTAWNAGGDVAGDINSVAEIIRDDGLEDPDQLIMGVDAFEAAIKNTDFKSRFDIRNITMGTISPMVPNGKGGNFRGTVEIGNYKYDIWTYGGRFKDPQTGLKVQYVDPASCIVRSSTARMDATFGAIPNIGKLLGVQKTNLLPEMPGRVSNVEGGMDMFTNVWLSEDGENLFGGVGVRPLLIPTAIDTYGNIATGV